MRYIELFPASEIEYCEAQNSKSRIVPRIQYGGVLQDWLRDTHIIISAFFVDIVHVILFPLVLNDSVECIDNYMLHVSF